MKELIKEIKLLREELRKTREIFSLFIYYYKELNEGHRILKPKEKNVQKT